MSDVVRKTRVRPKAARICREMALPEEMRVAAAYDAMAIFPANAPLHVSDPQKISFLTGKYWGRAGAELTVGFMEQTTHAVANKVLAHASRWSEYGNVKFRLTQVSPMIRVSFGPGGYWSYLGVDCRQIAANKQTMNLEGFTLRTPESEWTRVVTHEFGHALGCPHEHQRKEILDLLDEPKTFAYYRRTQGWSEEEVRRQVLISLEEQSLTGASPADPTSIMAYHFPGSITRNGMPIPGGADFSPVDKEYIAKTYPKTAVIEPPPVTPAAEWPAELLLADVNGRTLARYRKVTS